jgi:hypothetical protein
MDNHRSDETADVNRPTRLVSLAAEPQVFQLEPALGDLAHPVAQRTSSLIFIPVPNQRLYLVGKTTEKHLAFAVESLFLADNGVVFNRKLPSTLKIKIGDVHREVPGNLPVIVVYLGSYLLIVRL